jgi:L-asparaginase
MANIRVLATGGTIAGSAADSAELTSYKAGAIQIESLLKAVPQMARYADVSGEQIASINSSDMTDDVWLKLAARIEELAADDSVDGIVVTHGTDTMEETAYFINLCVKIKKPVVFVGAMRPATAISADGPLNLLNAVRLAAEKAAWGQGVLVVMNDEIHSARFVTKTNTTNVATFKSPDFGAVGCFVSGVPRFYKASLRTHTFATEFSVPNKLPEVAIIYGHAGQKDYLVKAAILAGARGIVYVGMGDGGIHQAVFDELKNAAQKGIVIVRASRCGSGCVPPSNPLWQEAGFVRADNLNAQKARVLLQVALTKYKEPSDIAAVFEKY